MIKDKIIEPSTRIHRLNSLKSAQVDSCDTLNVLILLVLNLYAAVVAMKALSRWQCIQCSISFIFPLLFVFLFLFRFPFLSMVRIAVITRTVAMRSRPMWSIRICIISHVTMWSIMWMRMIAAEPTWCVPFRLRWSWCPPFSCNRLFRWIFRRIFCGIACWVFARFSRRIFSGILSGIFARVLRGV